MKLFEIDWINFKKPKKNLYFLDKNVLQLIQELQEGKQLTKPNEIAMQTRLKKIDKSGNIVSLMFSIIEGRKGRKETAEEKQLAINEESNILNGFFKYATTDIDFFKTNVDYISELFSENHTELDEPKYISYLENFFELWKCFNDENDENVIPKNIRENFTDKLIENAKNLGIQLQHPVIVLTIGAIYGKEAAIQILKPKSVNIHNAYSDISMLSRLGTNKARFSQTHECEILTLDKGVLAWFEIFSIKSVKLNRNSIDGETSEIEINVKEKFLNKRIRDKLSYSQEI